MSGWQANDSLMIQIYFTALFFLVYRRKWRLSQPSFIQVSVQLKFSTRPKAQKDLKSMIVCTEKNNSTAVSAESTASDLRCLISTVNDYRYDGVNDEWVLLKTGRIMHYISHLVLT